ncbi:MAG: HlyD family efflux transporter periplasmic adaptor subunit [Spirochaetales bacterium]|nr:HlyD family efflux transporter periplasmic adaptor subunit [Spirochaetales bacterium]
MAKVKKIKRIALIVVASAAVGAAAAVFLLASGTRNAVPEVQAYTVAADTVEREVSANGVIGARDSETLVAQTSGIVSQVAVKKGDAVAKGQLIVRLDDEKIRVQEKEAAAALAAARRGVRVELLRLRSSLIKAQSEWEQADRDWGSAKELFAAGSVSEAEYTRAADRRTVAANDLLAARQSLNLREGRPKDDPRTTPPSPDDAIVEGSDEVRQAAARLESVRADARRTEVRCTMSGTVIDLPAEAGDVAAPGARLAEIADTRRLEVTSNIDEVDIGSVSVGQAARIESDVFLDRRLTGKVTEIAPGITKVGDARVCEIKVGFSDPNRLAKVGASCSIYINVARRENVPAIPLELYLQEGRKKYVFLISRDTAAPGEYFLKKTEIETGVLGLDKIEVTRGLTLGDRIARGQLKSFRDGQRVTAAAEKSAQNGGAAQ